MKRPATEPRGDRVVSILLSVLVHAVIVGALVWGWWRYRTPVSAPQTLAIQATVVRNAPRPAKAPPSAPTPPAPTPPVPTPPPPDTQSQLEHQARERAEAQQRLAAEAAAKAAQVAQVAQVAQQQREAVEAEAAEAAAAKAAAAKAEAEHQAKLEAERQAKQDAAREAQALAQQLKTEQAARQRAADLHAQLQAEEHLDALESSPAKAEYLSLIQAKISRAWIRPPSAQAGLKCIVHIAQIPGGEITRVTVEGCNGDEAVRQSVQTAAYGASPLPAPSDPALFDPNITVTFAPDQ